MILTAFHGFCMALADSVPGVSGGTIAFIPFIAAAERTALKRLRGALFALRRCLPRRRGLYRRHQKQTCCHQANCLF